MQDGTVYQLPPAVRLTRETASGFWHGGYPTPTAKVYGSAQNEGKVPHKRPSRGTPSLHTMATRGIWPTPTKGDSKASRSRNTPDSKAHAGISLTDAVRGDGGTGRIWPTPKASPSGPDYARVNRPESGGDDLATAVARTWPTPRASDWRDGRVSQETMEKNSRPLCEAVVSGGGTTTPPTQKGQLSPVWVEWLMGWPIGSTDLRFLAKAKFRRWLELHGIYYEGGSGDDD